MKIIDKKQNNWPVLHILSISVGLWLGLSFTSWADDRDSVLSDCSTVTINYLDIPGLTRAERLALMEQAFMDSVNRYEGCQFSTQATNQSSGQQGGGGGQGDAAGEQGNGGNQAAVANQDLQGTETEQLQQTQSGQQQSSVGEQGEAFEQSPTSSVVTSTPHSGAIPEDIPSANNDDAVAAQIRRAAENETDPEIQKKLWNEYRKYRGLNIVE